MVLFRRLLGDVLRDLRMQRGLTLREVSAEARVSLGYISEIPSSGQKEPPRSCSPPLRRHSTLRSPTCCAAVSDARGAGRPAAGLVRIPRCRAGRGRHLAA